MTKKRKVLVVDASKVVRASLTKQLSNRFEVRDEPNDESAWQTMVLDSAIVAVISGISQSAQGESSLIARLRESKLSRLKNVPFFLSVSNTYSEADREEARNSGVTGFVVKGVTDPSIESIVAAAMDWREDPAEVRQPAPADDEQAGQFQVQSDIGISNIMGDITRLLNPPADEPSEDGGYSEDTVLAEEMLEEYLATNVPEARDGHGVGVLAFGLDGYDDLVQSYGPELAFRSAQKFCFLLSRKIRPEDYIGQLANGRVVIVTRSTTPSVCAGFANRVCKAMASAQISVSGQRIHLTISVGVAVVPDDGVELTERGVLELAYDRLDAAVSAGGNQVVVTSKQAFSDPEKCAAFARQLKELLATIEPAALRPCLGTVGMQLMPILRELDKNFRFELPIEDMNKRLWDRARAERMVT